MQRRLRQISIMAVFVVGVFATAATQPASTNIDLVPAHASFRLDAEQPAALTRFIVALDAEATTGSENAYVSVQIDSARPVVDGGSGSGGPGRPRFIVTSATPGSIPPIGTSDPYAAPGPTTWQVEARQGSPVTLPIDCGVGPCERAFWLIAELTDAGGAAFDVAWHASGRLTFYGAAWPSGAGGTVEIERPIAVAGPVPSLVVSSESEALTLGPSQPAAAREIELTLGAAAVPLDGARVATMSVDLVPRAGTAGSHLRPPVVHVYPLDDPDGLGFPDPALPTAAPHDLDPFAGCPPGEDCTRRFLVTFAWAGEAGEAETHDWSVKVRRVDLVRAWATPADLTASVTRRFDVAPGSRSRKVHLEGDATAAPFDRPPQVQLQLAAETTATDRVALLLPVPAVMTYQAEIVEPDPASSAEDPNVGTTISGTGLRVGGRTFSENFAGRAMTVIANPMAGCHLGDPCYDQFEIETRANGAPGSTPRVPIRVHWSLDLSVYSFEEAPITLSVTDVSPPAR